ncbi:hypothetical protein S83_059648 [Arachis hypogaea]
MLSKTRLGVKFQRSFFQAPFERKRSFHRPNLAKAHASRPYLGRCPCRPGLVLSRTPLGLVKAALPLTIPCRVFKLTAKDSTRRAFRIALRGLPQGSFTPGVSPTARASWGPGPLLQVGKRAAGARIASSPDSDLEVFSDNSTHGSFTPLVFQPNAMTNCANQRFLSY